MKKNILVVSRGLIHPSLFCRLSLKAMLGRLSERFIFTFSGSLKGLRALRRGNYDAVILYYHEKKIDDESLNVLADFAENGGGVLALHSSMASFKTNKKYQELLGGRFTGHDRIEKVGVFAKEKEHPILKGAKDFTVRDELYVHEYHKNNDIILACRNKGEEEPILWTKEWSRGRVCYFAPGHCPAVWFNGEVKKIINNALLWVCKAEDEK